MSDAAPAPTALPQAPADAQQRPAPDVATQPVVPSESAGTQTAVGAPSKQEGAPQGAPEAVQQASQGPAVLPGAEVPAGEQPTAEEEAQREQGPPPAIDSAGQPQGQERPRASGVSVSGDVYRARSDNDVLTNSFCRVVAGPYAGRYGVFWSTGSLGADGWPDEVVVRTRDAEDENIVVAYSDIRPDVAGRR